MSYLTQQIKKTSDTIRELRYAIEDLEEKHSEEEIDAIKKIIFGKKYPFGLESLEEIIANLEDWEEHCEKKLSK